MKKRILYLMITCLVCGGQGVYAEMVPEGSAAKKDGNTYYVLWDTPERGFWIYNSRLEDDKSETIYTWEKGPGDILTFDARRNPEKKYKLDVSKGANGTFGSSIWSEMPGLVTETEEEKGWFGSVTIKEKTVEYVSYPQNGQTLLMERSTRQIRFASKYNNTSRKNEMFVKNVKVTMAKYLECTDGTHTAELTLDPKELGNESSGTFTFNWCNVSDVQVKVTKNAENFKFDALTDYSQAGAWGYTKLTVYCTHQTADENVGEIQISSASLGKTITVTLKSNTKRHPTTYTWNISDKISLGETINNVITITPADRQSALQLTSSDATILSTSGNSITALQEGKVILTAIVPQTAIQEAVNASMEVTVDNKQNQIITWDQNLGTKPIGTAPITLTATTNSNLPLIYTSSDPLVASVSGNVLTIHKTGRINITVSQAGDANYFPAELSQTIVIYDPSVACEDFFLIGGAFNLKQDLFGYGTGQYSRTWDAAKPAGELVFDVIGEVAWPFEDEDFTISIDVYRNGSSSKENDWKKITVSTKETGHHTITLDEDISGVNFRLDYQSGRNRTVKLTNIAIYQKRYIRPSESPIAFDAIQLGASATRTIDLKYSALASMSGTYIENNDGIFTVENVTFGEGCGSVGTATAKVTFSAANISAADAHKKFENAIVVVNSQSETILRIPISGSLLQGKWLPVMPKKEEAVGTPEYNMYQYLMYAHVNDELKTGAGLSANNIALDYSSELHVTNQMYYLMQVREADDWHTFVAPFDITNAYVLELTPEPADNRAEGVRADMIAQQNAANTAFYNHLLTTLPASENSLMTTINTYLAGLEGYAAEQVGIWPIEQSYELHEGADTWELTTVDGEPIFTKNWTEITPTAMTKGKTYAMRFPWCEYCTDRTPWDYWTGKLILFVGNGAQTISGRSAHDDITDTTPAVGEAILTGNYTLADMNIENAFIHNITTDMYEKVSGVTNIRPTTSVIYANIPAKQGKRAVAISRQGEIIWEDDAADGGDGGTVTGLDGVAETTLHVMAQEGGFSVLSSTVQALQIYGIDGRLVYTGTIEAGEAQFFSVTAGMYVVRTQTETRKVMAR